MVEPATTSRSTVPPGASRTATFPAFDGLRCLAAFAVLITHVAFISSFSVHSSALGPITARLDIGVAIFFVISGFLLYRPFAVAHLAGRSQPGTSGYARRRFLRIAPAYWVVLTLVVIVPVLRPHEITLRPGNVLAHYALIHVYAVRFGLPPVQQSWTLATEIAFYAFLPLWAYAMSGISRRSGGRAALRVEVAGIAVLYTFGLAWRAFLLHSVHLPYRAFMSLWLPARMDHFALGMALAVASAHFEVAQRAPRWTRSRAVPYVSWALAALAFWFLCFGFGLDNLRGPGVTMSHAQEWWLYFFWGVVGFFTVLPAVFGPQEGTLIHALLRQRVVAWLGMISYGIYLWHEAMLDAFLRWKHLVPVNSFPKPYSFTLMIIWVTALTIPAAALSWYLVERPALRLKNRPLWPPARARAPQP